MSYIIDSNKVKYFIDSNITRILLILLQIIIYILVTLIVLRLSSSSNEFSNNFNILTLLYFLALLIILISYYFIEFCSIYLHLNEFKIFNKYSDLKKYLEILIKTIPIVTFKYYNPQGSLVVKEICFDNIIDISQDISNIELDIGKKLILEISLDGVLDEQTYNTYRLKTKRVFSGSEIDIKDIYSRYIIYQCKNSIVSDTNQDKNDSEENLTSSINKMIYTPNDLKESNFETDKENKEIKKVLCNQDNNKLEKKCLYNKIFFIISIILCIAEFYKILLFFEFSTNKFRVRKQLTYFYNINAPEGNDDITIKVV